MDTHITNIDGNGTELLDGSDSVLINKIELGPGDLRSITLGIYEDRIPQPHFHADIVPERTTVAATLTRIEDSGEYKLVYLFQSFSDLACTITITLCDE